jgi:hypothetical protein
MTALVLLLNSCANQQPPGGGDEDKTPPKVKIIEPRPNSVNFRGRSLVFEFNEYIDRRSFQDAFRISPGLKGEIEYNWGAKDVEVIFPARLESIDANKTFVVNISTGLKDIRGNSITEPITFAFSTGSKIDMGGVSGVVYNNNKKVTAVFAYSLSGKDFNPTADIPDYITESSTEGKYTLTNLAPGKYRIITIIDEDRNLLFTSERESYGVLPYDVDVQDSVTLENINFYMKDVSVGLSVEPELDHTKYFKDSLGIVYTSVQSGSNVVLPDQSIFIFFNSYHPSRDELTGSLKITDENGTQAKVVYNWRNDSLVEVFTAEKFASNRKYSLTFSFKVMNDSLYDFTLPFRTVSSNSFGELKGGISSFFPEFPLSEYSARLELVSSAIVPAINYSVDVRDSVYSIKNMLEAAYTLFAYIETKPNSAYDYGYPYPFEHSEPFYIYPGAINIKGGWVVENVNVSFVK